MDYFTCEECGKKLPRYVNGEFQPSMGANFGWGMMEWCRECKPPTKNFEEIIEDFELFMFPMEELPN